jgi:hypothetical protein
MSFTKYRLQKLAGILNEQVEDRPSPLEIIDSGQCDVDDPINIFYHAAPARLLPQIKKQGLVPGSGKQANFSSLGKWSTGKLFVSQGEDNGRMWQEMLYDQLDEPIALLQVKLSKKELKSIQQDDASYEEGDPCSFYVVSRIPPGRLKVVDKGESISIFQ